MTASHFTQVEGARDAVTYESARGVANLWARLTIVWNQCFSLARLGMGGEGGAVCIGQTAH